MRSLLVVSIPLDFLNLFGGAGPRLSRWAIHACSRPIQYWR